MIQKLFPVQEKLIPILLNKLNTQSIYSNDICITAPTGSGKTLTYVLPILELLKTRIRVCIRAIVILPVGDLAQQVYNVFREQIDEQSLNLKVALLSTKHAFSKEQLLLVDKDTKESLVDIIVTTPGRLVDHIQKTEGFYLKDVNYLILDEADRILDQVKQNWLKILFNKLQLEGRTILGSNEINLNNFINDKNRIIPFQKILLSATLTRNPEKLEQVKLFQPLFYSIKAEDLSEKIKEEVKIVEKEVIEEVKQSIEVDEIKQENKIEIQIPNELQEFFVECTTFEKPLMLIYLIKILKYQKVLCFVRSLETAKRLNVLLNLNDIKSMEYSSNLHAVRRKRILNKFEKDEIEIIICSDVMARGMDLFGVNYVLLYEVPNDYVSYVHRIGRTARAGHHGTAITLLEHKEIKFFKQKIINNEENNKEPVKNRKNKVKEMKIVKNKLKELMEDYKLSLIKLKDSFGGNVKNRKRKTNEASDTNDNSKKVKIE